MKKFQIFCLIVFTGLLLSCASTKIYRVERAQMLGYKVAYERLKIANDSLSESCWKLEKLNVSLLKKNKLLKSESDSLVLIVDSLQVELEDYQ